MTKRRTQGDGGLYQRHDHAACPPIGVDGERPEHTCQGRWVGTIDTFEGGKRRRKYVYGRTMRAARLKLDRANRDKADGTLVVASMTLDAWMSHWLDHIAGVKNRPQTLTGYRSKVDCYIRPHLGRHRLTTLTPDHVRLMYAAMRGQGLSEATLRQTHAILNRALKVAVMERKLGRNPLDAVDPPTTETAKRARLSVAQAKKVLAHTDNARWWLALFCGMRQGEVLGLRWCDVDLEGKTLTIEQTLQTDEDGSMIFGPPKSAASRRIVPLLPTMLARMRLAWVEAGSPDRDSPALIFGRDDHTPMPPRADWQAWKDLQAAVGNPPVALHSARNTAADVLEAAMVPARLASQILGHAQVSMTHRYQRAELDRMTEALAAVEVLLELE